MQASEPITATDATHRSPIAAHERRSTPGDRSDRMRRLSQSTPSIQSLQAAPAVTAGSSARERNRQALSAALDEMERALSQASHEFKSPLTTILGCLQLVGAKMDRLASSPADAPDVGKTLAKIHELLALASRQVEFADRLASDLVDASRAHQAQLTLRLRLCALGQVVEEAVEGQRVAFPTRLISLDAPNKDIPVVADPARIAQVVTNFLTNALKYSSADQPVTVRVAAHGACARVYVRDFGPGLAHSDLKRIWNRFYRVQGIAAQCATRAGADLGLGLYIAREIIRGHGGRVGVTSKPTHGATFWFTLPLARAA